MNKFIVMMAYFFLSLSASSQETLDSNYAVYDGGECFMMLKAPGGWSLALEEAQNDGYSAAFYPENEDFIGARNIIYAWIFPLDTMTFSQFITADSLSYLKGDTSLKVVDWDTLSINDRLKVRVLYFDDPGGLLSIAAVAYFNALTEVVVYELNINNREDYIEASDKFEEAINGFGLTIKDE